MIEARGIQKIYKSGKHLLPVLKGVDMRIEKGEFAAIVGPSGAGKSTLLHIMGGLDEPTHGRVLFEEQDIYKLSDGARAGLRNTRIGFVFQFYHLLPEFTVFENTIMPAIIGARDTQVSGAAARQRVGELLETVGLDKRAHHFPSQLSGGEQQRAAIVRALMNEPSLLLCDEPTGNLDSRTGAEIVTLLKTVIRQRAMACLVVTHNEEIARQADRVYYLKDGLIVHGS
ncbi:MAG TPA: ABC transporter ATP-binding protein [Candidatus Omnitrophota bacterium]|nr:ABC transporter ATP-binding protein [Candidatus Omnitrophota bacterium]HNX82518.1 ABC transporter ATP-binding protein [Candidatus Omnitrophota bacterium]HPT07364.1 ABC transporter ATP-binding protein [Candidatus Omnitrophota bacterium]